MNISSGLAERIQQERTRLDLTQVQLAARLGCSRSVVFSYEDGRSSPTADWLTRFAGVGADVSYVLLGERLASTADEAWLLEHYRDLPDMFRNVVLSLIKQLCGSAKTAVFSDQPATEPDAQETLLSRIRAGNTEGNEESQHD